MIKMRRNTIQRGLRIIALMMCLFLLSSSIGATHWMAFAEKGEPADFLGEAPTTEPIESPTAEMTAEPTATLEVEPTEASAEEQTEEPTAEPTVEPTQEPSEEPTVEPTAEPTEEPTVEPTKEPTDEPTVEPTEEPTEEPTVEPTQEPTEEPTVEPTEEPTEEPTVEPTEEPSEEPTVEPTEEPTEEPTAEPSEKPTAEPEVEPTEEPAEEPTGEPTEEPTEEPEVEPTEEPSEEPEVEPTEEPSEEPTVEPTEEPSEEPEVEPTEEPTSDPVLEQLFVKGAMHLADFLILYPDAKLDGARYGRESVPSQIPATGNVNPCLFGFTIAGVNETEAATYSDVSAVSAVFDVMIPDGVRRGEDWKGPIAGVQERDYEQNFPVIVKNAAEGDAFSVEYRMEGLSINDCPIDGVGDIILDAETQEFIYIYLKELPWNRNADGYVVLPADGRLRIQAVYGVQNIAAVTPEPTEEPTAEPTEEPTEEPAPDPMLEQMFGAGAMYLKDFLALRPGAGLNGAAYGDVSVPAAGNVNPDAFRFLIPGKDEETTEYADVAALRKSFDVTIPDGVRDGEDWKGPVSGVREGEYAENFPVAVKRAVNAGQFPVIVRPDEIVPDVEYSAESLSINGHEIDCLGTVVLGDGDGEFVYIHAQALPGEELSGGYVVLPAESLRVQVNYAARETETNAALTYGQWLAQEAEKSAVLRKVLYEGWDPYSGTMSVEEFYELMDLFRRGVLPIREISAVAAEEEGFAEEMETANMPRVMFMFKGVDEKITQGPAEPPLSYDNDAGAPDIPVGDLEAYPPGLGSYSRPPEQWGGVTMTNNVSAGLQAVIIMPDADSTGNPGNVNTDLFPSYDGYYVRRVTVQNMDVSVLGAIKLVGAENYVYYYLTRTGQSFEVSTTMLPEGQKFIVDYYEDEFQIDYQLFLEENGQEIAELPEGISLDTIFGADRSYQTDGGAYAFHLEVPYGYTLTVYRQVEGGKRELMLGLKEKGKYTDINEGWALGMEPDYKNKATIVGSNIRPNINNGPSAMTVSGNYYNNAVDANRTIIGVLKKKDAPQFFVAPIYHNTDNVKERGTSAYMRIPAKNKATGQTEVIFYDYEDVYLWANGWDSKYDYDEDGKEIKGAGRSNIKDGNIATNDGWGWSGGSSELKSGPVAMWEEADGTYSYQWTWQTNARSDGFTLDSLEVNGIAIRSPFVPKQSLRGDTTAGSSAGLTWHTEADIPDGIHVRVELLMSFTNRNGNPQRVYRIIVTGARTNVTVSGMNLMEGTGAPEISVYYLEGIEGSEIQYYNIKGDWKDAKLTNVLVRDDDAVSADGDSSRYGANIRFKLANGYASPYYFFENKNLETIKGHASAERDEKTGKGTNRNAVQAYPTSGTMEPQYIYGPEDGWYYIRLNQPYDDNDKIGLLTIIARPVRYVVRYVPSYASITVKSDGTTWENKWWEENLEQEDFTIGVVEEPTMPTFEHYQGVCDESFTGTYNVRGYPREQFDDNDGKYYDTGIDTLIDLPSKNPSDVSRNYAFVDWVLVDQDYRPITVDDEELHYSNVQVPFVEIASYAIPDASLGGDDTDVLVLRMMPNWIKVTNPFNYAVRLRWVDAQGEVQEELFQGDWEDVLTDWVISEETGSLTVKVLTNSTPFLNWIANHRTYTFWDAVNNAIDDHDPNDPDTVVKTAQDKIEEAIQVYLPSVRKGSAQYETVLNALLDRDPNGNGIEDFTRLDQYVFQVNEDEGTIVIWMYENKGGLVFRKEVKDEPFIADDEYYFTISSVTVENGSVAGTATLTGVYKAYPEKAYDDSGNLRDLLDRDAWLVTFNNGDVVSIVKNDGSAAPNPAVTYFTLKDGEGIMLYVPPGTYTITETGSKGGGSYKVDVEYQRKTGSSAVPDDNWSLPDADRHLKGKETGLHPDTADIEQVEARVNFVVGERDEVHAIIFGNKTASLAIRKEIVPENDATLMQEEFEFRVWLVLPSGDVPLKEDQTDKYFYSVNFYDLNGMKAGDEQRIYLKEYASGDGVELPSTLRGSNNIWYGTLKITGAGVAAIVREAPDRDDIEINYFVEEIIPQDSDYHLYGEINTSGKIKAGVQEVATFQNTVWRAGLTVLETVVVPAGWTFSQLPTFDFEITLSDQTVYSQSYEAYITDANGNETLTTLTFDASGKATFSLDAGGFITIPDLPTEIPYTVTQTNAYSYYQQTRMKTGTIPDGVTTIYATEEFRNTVPVPLNFQKILAGKAKDEMTEQEFEFTVTFTAGEFELPGSVEYEISPAGTGGSCVLTKTGDTYTGTVKLKGGQSISIKNMPYGTLFEITESAGFYKTSVNGPDITASETSTVSGTLQQNAHSYNFTNTLDYGSLTVMKSVDNKTQPPEAVAAQEFKFEITLTPPADMQPQVQVPTGGYAYTVEGNTLYTDEDGTATIALKADQSFKFENLLPGTTYTVREILDDTQYPVKYNPVWTGNADTTGTITSGASVALQCINEEVVHKTLTVEKVVSGNMGSRMRAFTFSLTLKDGETALAKVSIIGDNGAKTEQALEDGTYKFELKHGESIVVEMPEGTAYKIVEETAAGYAVSYAIDGGDGEKGDTAQGTLSDDTTVTFTNTLNGPVPTGVHLQAGWIALMMLMALAGMAAVLCKRRRIDRREE